ncbi:phosphate ABC transporter permease PstA [Aliisedimentitalea scapharcae]|uniref:phosphate ABC transporter permease PstA n=1 Tax=Aliisedimentitalea scapharcae TaxID=1524259 RepID=UPI003873A033
MSDISQTPHGSLIEAAQSDKRLRRRKAKVTRLKTYGIAAIAASGLALVSLLSSVVVQTSSALTESYVTLPVTLSEDTVDPNGERNPKEILRADFAGLTKSTLREAFPSVKARKAKREMYDIVSGGAPFELAAMVSANPDLVGQTIDYRFLASDVTDLYLKGSYGTLDRVDVSGALSVEMDGKDAVITSTSDDFANMLAVVKRDLVADAAHLRRKAAMQNNGAAVFAKRAQDATVEEDVQKNRKLSAARAAERDNLLQQAADLDARAQDTSAPEELTRENNSLMVRVGDGWIKLTQLSPTQAHGIVLTPLSGAANAVSDWGLFTTELPEASRKVSDLSIALIEDLQARGAIDRVFNWRFFTASDSREPELAGVWGAAIGSLLTMLVTFSLAFPIGVSAAIYLEEFAPKNRFTAFIEVNINNLAAVPSIVFGLLGLSVFLGVFGVPRSSPLAGGIVLALMTLPTIIIAARAAIKAVPPSIRDAALGVGASKLQATFHHVLPLAMPGILTGTIIGMAQALGETAPLIMIGMVAFIVDIPTSITDSASVLPVQVFRWSDFPERAFQAKTGAAIAVLLFFLVAMNAVAIILRRRFERRW